MSSAAWAFTGMCAGFLVKAMRNSIGNLPMRRKPWEYVLHGGLCSYIFYKYPAYETYLLGEISLMREELGLKGLDLTKSRGTIAKDIMAGHDMVMDSGKVGINKYKN